MAEIPPISPTHGPQSEDDPGADSKRTSGLRAALGLLLPGLRGADRPGSLAAVHWLVPTGLAIGLIYAGVYRGCWRIFGEVSGVRLMPAVAVWLVDAILFSLPMYLGAARVADRWSLPLQPGGRADQGTTGDRWLGTAGVMTLMVLLVVKLVLWTAIPKGILGWPTDWRRYLNFLYPRPVFRPLILAPLWGRWALMLAGSIGRAAPGSGRSAPGLAGPASPVVVLGWFLVNLFVTGIYCGPRGRWMIGCIIGLVVLGVTFLFSVLAARRFGGRTAFTVYAAAALAEITFLIAYLAASQRIYRY